MYKVLLRLQIVKYNYIMEVYFDERLSFKDNLRALGHICNIENLETYLVFDAQKKLFLCRDIPIKEFNINYFMSFKLL